MADSRDISKRVLYAKYSLFRAAKSLAENSELATAASLLLMHDATELLMLAVAERHGFGSNWNFMGFWEKVKVTCKKELSYKPALGRMNDLRVNFKHKGILPHAQTVRDLMPTVEAFCQEISRELLDTDFENASLANLVGDADVRNTLREAKQAFDSGDRENAFRKLRLAFDKLHRQISKNISRVRKPQGIKIPRGKSNLSPETARGLLNLQGVVFDLVATVNTLMLGIDPVKHRFFIANTPPVSWTVSGLYQSLHLKDYNSVPDEVFHTCFEFVVDVALNASL